MHLPTLIGGSAHGGRCWPCKCCQHTAHLVVDFAPGIAVVETYRGRIWTTAGGHELRLPIYVADRGGPRG